MKTRDSNKMSHLFFEYIIISDNTLIKNSKFISPFESDRGLVSAVKPERVIETPVEAEIEQ